MTTWCDWDSAAYELGIALGLFNRETHPRMSDVKHVFWTNNPVGEALHECLETLVRAGVLLARGDIDEEEDDGLHRTVFTQFKWNPAFRGSWEEPFTPLQELTLEVFKDD